MIVEVRKYTIKPGLRARFIDVFETRAVPAQRGVGMGILGPLLDLENPDVFIWLRGFPSLEERERMKTTFYEGELWLKELEAIAMPMLERYEVILTETSPGVVRSEEHTSELQSQSNLVCRLLLEKKKKNQVTHYNNTIYTINNKHKIRESHAHVSG